MAASFRVRLIATAAAVVVAVLGVVLAVLWSGVRRVEADRLDARLCLEARRLASQPFRDDELRTLEPDVMAKLRLARRAELGLLVERNGAAVHRSPGLPEALETGGLEWRRVPDLRRGPPAQPEGPEAGIAADDRGIANRPPAADCELASFRERSVTWHAARVEGPDGAGLVAADAAAAAAEVMAVAKDALTLVMPLALLLAALGAWLLSSLAIRPIRRLRDAMRTVSEKDLRRRLETRGEDIEFRELILSYNAMLERLETSFEQASRFSADAAHELRTPLTILQGRLEQAIGQSEHRAIQAELIDMQEEIGRLASITRKLLLLARADAGKLALHRTRVDLTAILGALIDDARMLATDREVTSTVDPGLLVDGDEVLLRQMLNNLVSNAIRYCRARGRIAIAACRHGTDVEVRFVNSTDPIPEDSRRRIFDRFHRLDAARNRASEGTGLGLSLAREIARAHGGDLALEPGPRDEFRLLLRLPFA